MQAQCRELLAATDTAQKHQKDVHAAVKTAEDLRTNLAILVNEENSLKTSIQRSRDTLQEHKETIKKYQAIAESLICCEEAMKISAITAFCERKSECARVNAIQEESQLPFFMCFHCKKEYGSIADGFRCIQCDGCNAWQCLRCAGLNDDSFTQYSVSRKKFYCPSLGCKV